MTETTRHLTDELLRRAMTELAEGPDGTILLSDVLRSVDSSAQVRRRPWDVPGGRGAGLLVAAALLVTVVIGSALVLASRQPAPPPSPSAPALLPQTFTAPDFVAPFTYSLPAGQTVHLTPKGATTPATIYGRGGGTPSRQLQVFLVTGSVHACPDLDSESGVDRILIGTQPSAFLRELRNTVGVGIGPIEPATLGNLPALAADIDPSRNACSPILLHENGLGIQATGLEPTLDNPGRLIVGKSGAQTIAVLISASNEDDYAAWLPTAEDYVDTFAFDTTGD